jgi:hypothetical protein
MYPTDPDSPGQLAGCDFRRIPLRPKGRGLAGKIALAAVAAPRVRYLA